jgi:tetratricopeptide (TPR) repeat protein
MNNYQKASMRSILFLLVFLFSTNVFAQNTKSDSLIKLLNNTRGVEKLDIYYKLCKNIYKTQPEYTIELSGQMLELAQKMENDSFTATSYILTGYAYKVLEKPDMAISFFKKAYEIRLEIGGEGKIGSISYEIGNSYFQFKDNLDSSLFYFEIALSIYKKTKNLRSQANVLNKIGIVYRKFGEYDKAIEVFKDAIKLNEKLDSPKGKASLLTSIGSVYYGFQDYPNAKKFHREALKIRLKINNKYDIAGSYNNLATIYMVEDSLDKALEYYFKALAINNEIGNERWKSYNLHNIGIVYDMKGDLNKSLDYFKQSSEIKVKRNDLKGLASTYNSIGLIYFKMEDYKNALKYQLRSLEIGKQIKHRSILVQTYTNLASTYNELGNLIAANEALLQWALHKDTLRSEEKAIALAEFEAKYETEKKVKENELLKMDLEISNQKDKTQRLNLILLIVGFGASVIFIIFIFYYFRLKRKTLIQQKEIADNKAKSLQSKLEFKNRELASNAMFLAQNNELINKIITDVKNLENHASDNGRKLILKLIRELKKNSQDNAWKEFETRFESVHSDFYKNLNQQFPELTPNERKLCAFLRLNMTTKDISALTYQSVRSIETARLRLRKKLDISTDTNLVNFLSGF